MDALLAAGVQPLVNLFHWDLPQALQDRGGFANPEAAGWFTDYTSVLASTLGDRVTDWMTFNEPAVFAFLGHADGIHAPGLRDWPTAIRVADNELRAHAGATQAIRGLVEGSKVGMAIDVTQVVPATARSAIDSPPASGAPLATRGSSIRFSVGATRRWGARRTARRVISTGSTSPSRRPAIWLHLGLNYYRRDSVSARSDLDFDWEIGAVAGSEQTQMDWHVAPDGLRDTLIELNRTYAPREVVVTENGAAYPDTLDGDGRVRDTARLDYLARHIAAASEALDAGVPLTGYHVWSFMDNYEWSLGYTRRFAWSTSTTTRSAARPRTARAGISGSRPEASPRPSVSPGP